MKVTFTLLIMLLGQLYTAQLASCTEHIEKIKLYQLQIDELSRHVSYYKNLIKSSKTLRTTSYEGIQFGINQVIGSKKDGSIIVSFFYKNISNKQRDMLQCERAIIIDTKGDQYQTNQVFLSLNGKILATEVLKDMSYKGGMIFKKNTSYFPIIKALIIYVYPMDNLTNPQPIVFENIAVVWE